MLHPYVEHSHTHVHHTARCGCCRRFYTVIVYLMTFWNYLYIEQLISMILLNYLSIIVFYSIGMLFAAYVHAFADTHSWCLLVCALINFLLFFLAHVKTYLTTTFSLCLHVHLCRCRGVPARHLMVTNLCFITFCFSFAGFFVPYRDMEDWLKWTEHANVSVHGFPFFIPFFYCMFCSWPNRMLEHV